MCKPFKSTNIQPKCIPKKTEKRIDPKSTFQCWHGEKKILDRAHKQWPRATISKLSYACSQPRPWKVYFLSDVDLTRVVCTRPADRRHPQDPIFDTSRADRGDRGIPDRIVNDSVAKVRSKLFYRDDLKREPGAKLHNLAPLYLLKKRVAWKSSFGNPL